MRACSGTGTWSPLSVDAICRSQERSTAAAVSFDVLAPKPVGAATAPARACTTSRESRWV